MSEQGIKRVDQILQEIQEAVFDLKAGDKQDIRLGFILERAKETIRVYLTEITLENH